MENKFKKIDRIVYIFLIVLFGIVIIDVWFNPNAVSGFNLGLLIGVFLLHYLSCREYKQRINLFKHIDSLWDVILEQQKTLRNFHNHIELLNSIIQKGGKNGKSKRNSKRCK